MKTFRTAALAFAVAAALAGCNAGRDQSTDPKAADPGTTIEQTVESNVAAAVDKARRELATENIRLDGPIGTPKAEITPKGDLLIDGTPVPVTDEQRTRLLEYRRIASDIASAGMEIGVEGARLATTAVGAALRAVFSGGVDEVERRTEERSEPIRRAALRLCERLPAMLDAQQALAASLPAFAPYATMDRSDIEDCRVDAMSDRAAAPPAPPAPPSPPAAPPPPPKGTVQAGGTPSAKGVIGKPALPELPDPTG